LNTQAAVAELKKLIIELGLPRSEMAFFGIRCPYCGKSDRIRQLEPPEELTGMLDTESLEAYRDLWRQFTPSSRVKLGVCKFCQNPLEMFYEKSKATPLIV
jgi:hypothetical protein